MRIYKEFTVKGQPFGMALDVYDSDALADGIKIKANWSFDEAPTGETEIFEFPDTPWTPENVKSRISAIEFDILVDVNTPTPEELLLDLLVKDGWRTTP